MDLPIRMPNPSPTLDKNLASMGPGFLSSIGVGVWRKAPEAFPGSNTTLHTFQSAILSPSQLQDSAKDILEALTTLHAS